MDWTIHEANIHDAPQIMTFMQRMAQEPDLRVLLRSGTQLEEEQAFIRHYRDRLNSAIFIVEHDGAVIGYARATGGQSPYTYHIVELGGVAIRGDYRGQGAGKALVTYALDWAKANPYIERVQLEVSTDNLEAIRFYYGLGFQLEGIREKSYYIDGRFYDSLAMAVIVNDTYRVYTPKELAIS